MNTRKVFVLFNGCYSDTRVAGVYSTQANANLAARIFSDDPHTEEWNIDEMVPQMRKGYRSYFVRLERESGATLECEENNSTYGALSPSVGEDVNRNLYTHCWAPNKEHAVKIASERRRVFLATREAK